LVSPSTITIGIDPMIHIGPVTLAWHGVTIALGILIGGAVAGRYARERQLPPEPLFTIGMILVVSALVGGRLYYLAERGQLPDVGDWLGTRGFTFYGGFIAAALGIGIYLWRARLTVGYLDAGLRPPAWACDRAHRGRHQRRALWPGNRLLPGGSQRASRRRRP
jgi:phosphatidylglycerol:prolipoprotein diacylglycerol transferase